MSVATEKPPAKQPLFNVPNQLTVAAAVSIVLFVLIGLRYYLTESCRCLPSRPAPIGWTVIGPASTAR